MTDPEFWEDGSPIIDYPYHDEVEMAPEPEDYPMMVELVYDDDPYVAAILKPVDATSAWQTLRLGRTGSDFTYDVISRGPVPRIDQKEFGDLAENVLIHTNPEDDGYTTIHGLTYTGDLVGLEMFKDILTTTLDRGAEGDRDMIVEAGGPLLWLDVFLK